MNFTSQICTSRSQSERLLALGLKKETADMTLQTTLDVCYTMLFQEAVEYFENRHLPPHPTILPAWSLHRLMCLCPTEINGYDFYVSHDYVYYLDIITDYNDDKLVGFFKDNPFDSLIDCIEWLIKEGYFNKEYLE